MAGAPPGTPPGAATVAQAPRPPRAAGSYPVELDLDAPLEVARWRPLVHWLLAIPHLVVASILQWIGELLTFVAFFTILFTARIPEGIFGFMVMTYRYRWRVNSYFLWMREPYPPFDFTTAAEDPGGDPAILSIEYPERLSRWMPFVKWLLAIPHFIVLLFLAIGAIFVILIGWFAVLITGRWPAALRDYLVGLTRWTTRVEAYVFLLTDSYPPFSMT